MSNITPIALRPRETAKLLNKATKEYLQPEYVKMRKEIKAAFPGKESKLGSIWMILGALGLGAILSYRRSLRQQGLL